MFGLMKLVEVIRFRRWQKRFQSPDRLLPPYDTDNGDREAINDRHISLPPVSPIDIEFNDVVVTVKTPNGKSKAKTIFLMAEEETSYLHAHYRRLFTVPRECSLLDLLQQFLVVVELESNNIIYSIQNIIVPFSSLFL